MRYVKMLTLALAAFCVMAIAAATAQAEEAQLAILPNNIKFSFSNTAGTKTLLETLSGKKVECLSVTGSGEAGVDKRLGTVEFKFVDCTTLGGGIKCTGLEDATAGNITFKGEYHLRHLLPASEGVSIMILVGHVHFTCGGIALILVLGSVCSDDLLTKAGGASAVNLLLASVYANFLIKAGTTGDPAVTEVDTDNGLAMEKCELLTKEGSSEYESSAQKGEGLIEKCKAGTAECTFLIELKGTF